MAQRKHGRRAADTKVRTPLSDLTDLLRADSNALGKRAAVVAAGAGLALSVAAPAVSDTGEDAEAVSSVPEDDYQAQDKVVVDAGKDDSLAGAAQASVVTAAKAPKKKAEPSASAADQDGGQKAEDAGKISGSKADKVLSIAKGYVGTPYVWGGTSPSGWDCSGFTSYVYGKVGVNLPRSSGAQKGAGTVVPRSQAKPGDLMWHPGHVGIYAGGGKMIDARNKRTGTVYTSAAWMSDAVYIRVL